MEQTQYSFREDSENRLDVQNEPGEDGLREVEAIRAHHNVVSTVYYFHGLCIILTIMDRISQRTS